MNIDRNNTKKPKKVLFVFVGIVLIIIGMWLIMNKQQASLILTNQNELVFSYHAHFSHIDIYQQDQRIVINTYSDDRFDDPNQIVIATKEKISKENITVEWETIGGKPVNQDRISTTAARVQIKKNNVIVFDGILDLFENGWQILDKVIGKKAVQKKGQSRLSGNTSDDFRALTCYSISVKDCREALREKSRGAFLLGKEQARALQAENTLLLARLSEAHRRTFLQGTPEALR